MTVTPLVKVGDICEQIRGVTYSKTDSTRTPRETYLPVLRANNITEFGLTADDLVYVPEGKVSSKQRIRKNDIVIAASSGSLDVVGKAARSLTDFEGSFGAFCKVLRPIDTVDPGYFAQFFQTKRYRQRISSLAAGANINNLRNEHLNELEIPLPPLPEQRRIAAILDKGDALRAKRREAIAKCDQLLQSVFLDMFGDPVTNPRGWPTSTIGKQCVVGTGSTPSRNNPANYDGSIPWVKSTEVDWGVIESTGEFVSEDGSRAARLKTFDTGSVVVALYGQGKTRGKCALLGMPATLNQACAAISPSESITSEYLFWLLRYSYQRLRAEARGGNQENLNLSILKNFALPVPSLSVQQRFIHVTRSLNIAQARSSQAAGHLSSLFSSLQHRAFTGQLSA